MIRLRVLFASLKPQALLVAALAAASAASGCSQVVQKSALARRAQTNAQITRTDQDGANAYKSTAYVWLRQQCISCHQSIQSPFFASDDLLTAFYAASSKVDFNNIPASILIAQSKNGHCGTSVCRTDGVALTAAVQLWQSRWTAGAAKPTVQWDLAGQTVSEAAGTVTVTATLSAASDVEIRVPVLVTGTATSPDDHTLRPTEEIVFNPFQTTASFTFNLIDDSVYEGNESVILTLGASTVANLGTQISHVVTVTDNEVRPTLQFTSTSQLVAESVGTVTATVQLSGMSATDVTLPVTVSGTATNPSDHNLPSTLNLVIPAKSLTASITFNVVKDNVTEPNETVVLTLGAPLNATLGANRVHTVTISDAAVPLTVQWSMASQTVSEAVGAVTLTAILNQQSSVQTTVQYQVSGTATGGGVDHTLASGTLTIPALSTSQNLTFNVANDPLNENDETVIVTLSGPSQGSVGTNSIHTVTIQDNDPAPTVQFAAASQTVAESAGTGRITVALSAKSGKDVMVPYTVTGSAVNPGDHNLSAGTLKITAGQLSADIVFNLVNDSVAEASDETIVVNLSPATNATLGTRVFHVVTITDDDIAPTAAMEAFRGSVYQISRANCYSCHETTTTPFHASTDVQTAYFAAKSKVDFVNVANSIMVQHSKDGHCGTSVCMTDGTAMIAAINTWKPYEVTVTASPTPTPTLNSGAILVTADTQLRLGTRQHVASVLTQVFGSNTALFDPTSIVTGYVLNNLGHFGGPCDPYSGCANRPDSQLVLVPSFMSTRAAFVVRACDKIVNIDNAVNSASALALGGASGTSRFPTSSDVLAVYHLFHPNRTPSTDVAAGLLGVSQAAQAKGYASIEGWRFVLLAMCYSPDWQMP